jgi:hypothetical protein
MKLKFIVPLLLTASTVASANEYQTFTNLNYSNIETPIADYDGYSLGVRYFFDAKSTLGPLAEFDYINTTSSLFGGYADFEGNDEFTFGGEYFAGNFMIGTAFNSEADDDPSSLTLGYLINKNFIVKLNSSRPFGDDSTYSYHAQYNHQLDGNDYLGFSFTTDDDFDYQSYSATYFTKLAGQGYLKANVSYRDGLNNSHLSTSTSYYFNDMTSVSLMLDEDSNYGFGVNHFFNETYSIGGNYSSADDDDIDIFRVNFSARF